MFGNKNIENRPKLGPSGGHPFRTPGVPITDEPGELGEELPKYLFTAECKPKKQPYGADYFDVLANTYDEVLKFIVEEMKYKEEDVKEIKRRGTLIKGTLVIGYKH